MKQHGRSIRVKMLVPLVGTAAIASLLVAMASWSYGRRQAQQAMLERIESIRAAFSSTPIPLTSSALNSLSQLTSTQWIALSTNGDIARSTLAVSEDDIAQLQQLPARSLSVDQARRDVTQAVELELGNEAYFAYALGRPSSDVVRDGIARVIVLFERRSVQASARQTAITPLATGLSTILLIVTTTWLIMSRLVKRITVLQEQVDRVAAGDFSSQLTENSPDELGQLSIAINQMTIQLDQLWKEVKRDQRAKLLHQVASGMAHQLRNTLTGARMAIELHQAACQSGGKEAGVAINQLEIAEDYVSRLLSLGTQDQQVDQQAPAGKCLFDLQASHQSIAQHLKRTLRWQLDQRLEHYLIKDERSLNAAVSNLVLNALAEADEVTVRAKVATLETGPEASSTTAPCVAELVVDVVDNGAGVDPEVAEQVFEAFVTTKPEGMGLGLAVVKRSAERLGGSVTWVREDQLTRFTLTLPAIESPSAGERP
ncbi:Globin-coupled histidine kinase [Stieleria bergensis]|uniref:histidine kinase n=1 Tax=Stieleria bergensis TaxID=2528025 RepID=A0A517T0U9_9BACT|nr:Globin-coupled histidine kinase [Planctomycetes bacterium SV_7m_r]